MKVIVSGTQDTQVELYGGSDRGDGHEGQSDCESNHSTYYDIFDISKQ